MIKTLIVLLVSVAVPLQAQYLDPGTGSYILQILIAAALVSVFYFKQIFAFVKKFVAKAFRKSSENGKDE